MLEIVFIGLLVLIPLVLSEVGRRRARRQWQTRLKQILNQDCGYSGRWRSRPSSPGKPPAILGDRTCVYNARSAHLCCAVNPSGPCSDCPHYQPRFKTLKKGE
ncbi:MAG: DUF6464 family protein [Spirulinaceae cyanobacterium]